MIELSAIRGDQSAPKDVPFQRLIEMTQPSQSHAKFVVSAVVLRDERGRILVVRKRDTSRYMLPGGKIEAGETPAQAAIRELHEEVGAVLNADELTFLGQWTTSAANEPGHLVHGHIFEHPWIAGLSVQAEIDDLLWLHPDEMATRNDLAPLLIERVLPALGF